MSDKPTSRKRKDPRNGKIKYARVWLNDMGDALANLSATAVGAYWLMFQRALKDQHPLPDDKKTLTRITRVSPKEWPDIREELLDVFEIRDGYLVDEMVEQVLNEFRSRSNRNKANINSRYKTVGGGLEDAEK